jgi:formylglycine-generating enzyme required for sulfatase activity
MNRSYLRGLAFIGSFFFTIAGCDNGDGPESPQNTPPTACFTVDPDSATTDTDFQFDASCCTDQEDPTSTLQVRWDWDGDGTWDTGHATAKTASHQYAAAGTMTIGLEVKDTGGLSSSTTRAVQVTASNSPPVACFTVSPPDDPIWDPSYQLDASCSTDRQDSLTALEVRWDWDNDGTWDTGYTTGKTASHQYEVTGIKTIKLEVKDTSGLTSSTTQAVEATVANTAPVACFAAAPPIGTTATNYQLDASCCSDLEGPLTELKVRWDWENDGTWDTGYVFIKTASHQYETPGTKTIQLEVKDRGGLTGTTTGTVTVSNTVPTAAFDVDPQSASMATTFQFDASGSSDGEDSASALEVRWDWEDDGTWDTSYTTAKITTHQYAATGMKTVKLEVKDSGGLVDSTTAQVSVTYEGGFVLASPGTFTMGSPVDEHGRSNKETQHQVTLTKPFYLCDHEVTQSEWESVMGWNHSSSLGVDHPVELVSWYQAVQYCNDRSIRDGYTPAYTITSPTYSGNKLANATVTWDQSADGYRLPTEAEWEYACRAGSTTAFCNGPITESTCNPIDPNLNQVGWYCGNARTNPKDVGGKNANAWGLRDMHGNVYEWCWDWYGSYEVAATDPTGPESGTDRVQRGGSHFVYAMSCRSASRYYDSPSAGSGDCGFRLARTVRSK